MDLIGNETTAAETARASDSMHPFEPLRVQMPVRLLVLWLKHSNFLLKSKVPVKS